MSNYPPGVTSADFSSPKRYHYLDNVLKAEPIEFEGMLLDADVRSSVSLDSQGCLEVESLEIILPIVMQHERFGPIEVKLPKSAMAAFRLALEELILKQAERLPSSAWEGE